MAELKDFIDDWNTDIKNKSATHKSGLKIGYAYMNEDGTYHFEYKGMSTFTKNILSETKNVESIEQRRKELVQEFIEIFKQKMLSDLNNKIPVKTASRDY